MTLRSWIREVARSVFFDKDVDPDCGFQSENVEDAIYELCDRITVSASPGFTYGRSGNLPKNTWLLNDTVPSNKSGRINFLNSATITQIFVANEDLNAVKLEFYSHDGDENNLTLLGSVTTAAQRSNVFVTSFTVGYNKQIGVKVADDTPNSGKNIDLGLRIQGTL